MDTHGVVEPDALARTLSSRVTVVAVMTANNETGVIQPLHDIVEAVRRRAPNAYVFTDAVQAAPYLDLAEATAGADLVSVERAQGRRSGRGRSTGGERSRRARSRASTGAARSASGGAGPRTWRVRSGLAVALRLVSAERAAAVPRSRGAAGPAGRWAAGVDRRERTAPCGRRRTGSPCSPGHLHLCVPEVEREEVLVALGEEGVCVSGGSSCASGALEPSHVLAAMGVAPELAAGALRFTLGYGTSDADIDRALAVVPASRRRAAPGELIPGGTLDPMRVLVAMSGGVDSSVAAALLVEQGHEVVGATLKLWGGPSDSGCCSVADVEDARRVAQQLGITHHVFNLTEEFDRKVVAPYVGEHARGRTPNPCIECNRSMKFDRLLHRADRLGFDRLATGHHARVSRGGGVAPAPRAPTRPRTSPTCSRCSGRTRCPVSSSPSAR